MVKHNRVTLGLLTGFLIFSIFDNPLQAKEQQPVSIEVTAKQRNNRPNSRLAPLRLVLKQVQGEGRRWAIHDPRGFFNYLRHPDHLPNQYERHYSLDQSEQQLAANIINSINSEYFTAHGSHIPHTNTGNINFIHTRVSGAFVYHMGRAPSNIESQGIRLFVYNKLREVYRHDQGRRAREN